MDNQLISAYINSDYRVSGFNQSIQIGVNSKEVDAILSKKKITEWAFITAYNPLSVPLESNDNMQRNEQLRSLLSEFYVLDGEGQDKEKTWPAEKSFFVAGISLNTAKALARRFGQRAIVFGTLHQPAELITTLDFIGNSNILLNAKTAFLCSRQVPASVVFKCYDWAIEQREKGICVISGFHSQIEKDVLHYLLKGKQPIILALARGLKEKLEPEFVPALEQGKLLIITPFDKSVKRVSSQTAQTRNQLMTDLADQITIGYASPGGQLEELIKGIEKPINNIL